MSKQQSGIYAIVNKVNGKRYVGSTANFRTRKINHWSDLRCDRHPNNHLQAAWNKYGEKCFAFIILEHVLSGLLLDVEQKYLDANGDGYNQAKSALSPMKGRTFSKESIKKLSAFQKGRKKSPEHRAKIGLANRGKKRSAEVRAKLSAAGKGKHSRVKSLEERRKLSIANKGKVPSAACMAAAKAANTGRPGWNKGKPSPLRGIPRTAEVRAKLSASHKGKILSAEHKANMSAAQKGKPWTAARWAVQERRVKDKVTE